MNISLLSIIMMIKPTILLPWSLREQRTYVCVHGDKWVVVYILFIAVILLKAVIDNPDKVKSRTRYKRVYTVLCHISACIQYLCIGWSLIRTRRIKIKNKNDSLVSVCVVRIGLVKRDRSVAHGACLINGIYYYMFVIPTYIN